MGVEGDIRSTTACELVSFTSLKAYEILFFKGNVPVATQSPQLSPPGYSIFVERSEMS